MTGDLMVGSMVGSNDIPRAAAFYDELMALLGSKRTMEVEGKYVAWGTAIDKPGFAVIKPYDGKPATVGNGCMTVFAVDSKEKVHTVYDKAIALGAKDEGPAGPRSEKFYAAYFRDLDGNKLNVFCLT